MLLVGDIGGTKTNLAVYASDRGLGTPVAEATYPSGNYASLEAIALEFLNRIDERAGIGTRKQIDRACFGVSGPVVAGSATITNLPWIMDQNRLQTELGLKFVRLLNDLEAIANAVPILQPDQLHTLSAGKPSPGRSIAVIAPGTGLGEAYLTWDGARYRAYACEGGHSDFAPTNAFEIGLLNYLLHEFDHVSYERVCSGKGLPNLYAYIKDCGIAEEPDWLAQKIAEADDPSPLITSTALAGGPGSELCIMALNLFVSILGAEAGNLALKLGALGGVYLGGGIPPRVLSVLSSGHFLQAFHRKGRLSDILIDTPVYVILDAKAGLLGAARYGIDIMDV